MGVYANLKKGRHSICIGRSHTLVPDGWRVPLDKSNIKEAISYMQERISDYSRQLQTLVAYSSKDRDDLDKVMAETGDLLDLIAGSGGKLSLLILVRDLLEDGYKLKVG